MKKINFALVSDVLFFTLCAFIICFVAVRYFFKSVASTVVLSAGVAAAVCLISLFALMKRREKKLLTTIGEGERKQLAIYLATLPLSQTLSLFLSALEGTYTAGNHIEDEQNDYRFLFKPSPVNADDVAQILRDRGEKPLVLLCCAIDENTMAFAADFSVRTICIADIYDMLKRKDLLPSDYQFAALKKRGAFSRVKSRFNRRLCPSLFFSGLFLALYSFFSFYPVWYAISGELLILLSAISLFFSER